MEEQPIQINEQQVNQEHSPVLSGPVFDAGPGWGKRLNNWLNKYFSKIILPIVSTLIFIVGLVMILK